MTKPFVSVIIVAAGKGTRMQSSLNKQYLYLNGKPILAHTLKVFENCDLVDEIILVVSKNDNEICLNKILKPYKIKKITKMVFGGETRQQSMYQGIMAVNQEADIIMTHDGARPLIHKDIIIKSIKNTLEYKATVVAVPVKNTIKIIDGEKFVLNTPERSSLWSVQTPQTFEYNLLRRAHEKAIEDDYTGTDDSVLVERLGQKIKIIKGHYDNIKITTPEDLIMAEAIINIFSR